MLVTDDGEVTLLRLRAQEEAKIPVQVRAYFFIDFVMHTRYEIRYSSDTIVE